MIVHYMYDYKPNIKFNANDGLALRRRKQVVQKQVNRELDEDMREVFEASSATEYLRGTK